MKIYNLKDVCDENDSQVRGMFSYISTICEPTTRGFLEPRRKSYSAQTLCSALVQKLFEAQLGRYYCLPEITAFNESGRGTESNGMFCMARQNR